MYRYLWKFVNSHIRVFAQCSLCCDCNVNSHSNFKTFNLKVWIHISGSLHNVPCCEFAASMWIHISGSYHLPFCNLQFGNCDCVNSHIRVSIRKVSRICKCEFAICKLLWIHISHILHTFAACEKLASLRIHISGLVAPCVHFCESTNRWKWKIMNSHIRVFAQCTVCCDCAVNSPSHHPSPHSQQLPVPGTCKKSWIHISGSLHKCAVLWICS